MTTASLEEIHGDAVRLGIGDVASYLQDLLGQKLTGYLAGLKDEKMVGRWAAARSRPQADSEDRLRAAYQAGRLLEGEGRETVRAWFCGANPLLGDRAPAAVLRESRDSDTSTTVVPAARAFIEGVYA